MTEMTPFERLCLHQCMSWVTCEEPCERMKAVMDEIDELRESLSDIIECPHGVDQATISKEGIEAHPEQVILEYSIGLQRVQRARKILKGSEEGVAKSMSGIGGIEIK